MSNKPSKEQRNLMRKFQDHTGFGLIGKDRVTSSDPKGFIEIWDRNVKWLKEVADETKYMLNDYRNKHGD